MNDFLVRIWNWNATVAEPCRRAMPDQPSLVTPEVTNGDVFRSAVTSAHDGVTITDARLDWPGPRIVFVNRALLVMTGYDASELIGRDPRIFQGPKTDRSVLSRLRENLERNATFSGHTVNYRKDGSPFEMEWTVSPVQDDTGRVTHYVAIQRDITERVQFERNLEYLAYADTLTGLTNRFRFEQIMDTEIRRTRRTGNKFSVVFFDIDNFKDINDTYGHQTGDAVLKQFAGILSDYLRDTDAVARWGGEEFAALLPETQVEGGRALADRVRRVVATTPMTRAACRISVSAGVATALPEDTSGELVRRADAALYAAKTAGRDCVQVQSC